MANTSIGYLKIATCGAFYVYDTSTNALIPVEEPVYRALDDYLSGEPSPQNTTDDSAPAVAEDVQAFFEYARNELGMFRPHANKDYSLTLEPERMRTSLSRELQSMGLNASEQCNQRCRYCLYSGDYDGERPHRETQMSWEVARRSVEYFLEHAQRDGTVGILFYGGEPLLNWKVLRRATEHARSLRPENLDLTLTTNLTIARDEMLDFLIENDVAVNVSLDGPPEFHDAARLFINGKGTHARVVGNLDKIRTRDEAYFRRRVRLLVTFDRNRNIHELFDYFCAEPFCDVPISLNSIRSGGADEFAVSDDASARHLERVHQLVDRYLESLRTGAPFHYRLFQDIFRLVFLLLPARKPGIAGTLLPPNGACVPGTSHLLVDASGQFYTCEKVCSPGLEIGDCWNGFDEAKVQQLLSEYVGFCNELCQECWAYRLCPQCFLHAVAGARLSKEKKRAACERTRLGLKGALEIFVRIWENEPEEPVAGGEYTLHAAVAAAEAERAAAE